MLRFAIYNLCFVSAVRADLNFIILQIVASAPGFPHGIIDPIEVCDYPYIFCQ